MHRLYPIQFPTEVHHLFPMDFLKMDDRQLSVTSSR
jgi:hypothetical protein